MREASDIRSIFQAALALSEEVTVRSIVGQLRNPGRCGWSKNGAWSRCSRSAPKHRHRGTKVERSNFLATASGRASSNRRIIFPARDELKQDKILLAGSTDTFESARHAIEGEQPKAAWSSVVPATWPAGCAKLLKKHHGTSPCLIPIPKPPTPWLTPSITSMLNKPTPRSGRLRRSRNRQSRCFVSLTESDEHNLLASSTAHSRGSQHRGGGEIGKL